MPASVASRVLSSARHAVNGVIADTQLLELLQNVANGVLTASDAAVQLNQARCAAAVMGLSVDHDHVYPSWQAAGWLVAGTPIHPLGSERCG